MHNWYQGLNANHKNPVCTGLRCGTSQTKPHSTVAQKRHTWHDTIGDEHVYLHTREAIIALGLLPWRIRWCELSAVNEGDNKVRDHESRLWLLSSCRSPRQEESADGNRRHKPGVRRHLLPLMSTVTTTLAGANSKNYLAGLQPPFVPAVTDNCVQSA